MLSAWCFSEPETAGGRDVWPVFRDRVGGRVTPPVRPHHRAYGSVHGGSSAPLQIPELSQKVQESPHRKQAIVHGRMHVRGPRVPPGASPGGGGLARTRSLESQCDHFATPSLRFLPLLPQDFAEAPANPLIQFQAAYPIHPEIFDRLYTDWSTLVKFQRTRGVLRLMATVIHSLWEKGDRNPLILPSTVPIDDARVQSELTRYLSDNCAPIIEKDVDGPTSLPLKIDAEQPTLGKLHATRRVARTIYLGSAPTATAAGVGALIQRGGRAVAGMLPIATAGGA